MDRKVCGEFPEFCYKGFDCKQYAEQFKYFGIFHMGCLPYYREVEDESRRDPTEGIGRTKEPGNITVGWVSPNPAEKTIWTREIGHQDYHILPFTNASLFCFCTCLPDVDLDHVKDKFGRYIVKINDPKQLAEDIHDYYVSKGQRFLINGCRVVYNKGEELDRKLSDNERLDMAYKQKPGKFGPDREFRIVVIKSGEPCPQECKFLSGQFEQVKPKCDFIVKLNKPLNYVSLVYLE